MALTLAQLQTLLVNRRRGWMARVGMDVDTLSTPNADLAGPIGRAVRQAGGTTADPTAPGDADLATVSDPDALLDLADLSLVEAILGQYDEVDEVTGPDKEALAQFGARVERELARLAERCKLLYGVGLGTASLGSIDLDFQQHCRPWEREPCDP